MRELSNEQLAYIAGFLDCDGSIFCQLVKGESYKYGYHIRVSVVFYQRKDKLWFLMKLRLMLGYGYIRRRNDNLCEYVITGAYSVSLVLEALEPFIVLKSSLLKKVLEIISLKQTISSLEDFKKLCALVDSTEYLTYSKNRKNKNVFQNDKISP